MDQNQAFVVFDIVRGSLIGEMTFPDVVGRLMEVGVERYHADYSRQEKTFYWVNGESLVVTVPYAQFATGGTFSVTKVQEAVRQSQRNEHTYLDFVEKTMAAGCVGYFVQITGRRAIYFGRNGESHVELFPSEPVD